MIWVTLSEPSANTFAASLVAAGFPVLQRPVTRIRPLPVVFAPGLETPRYVICLSRHAAEQYAAHYDQNERLRSVQSVVHVAIGVTTAYPLRPIGCPVVLPASASSEGILDLPQLADLASEDNVWLLTGVAGVATVQRSLKERCRLHCFELYSREVDLADDLAVASITTWVVGSVHGLHGAWDNWQRFGGGNDFSVVVFSERIARAAEQLGIKRLTVAAAPQPNAVIAAVKEFGYAR